METNKYNSHVNTIDECLTNGVNNGLFHINIDDQVLNGRTVQIDGNKLINFTSCSYLGLETDDRLKQGAINAVMKYGTQYSSSRAYSKCPLYEELEALFYDIFGYQTIVGPTTTLTHVAAIPILVGEKDFMINDHQVHASVQIGTQLAVAKGVKLDLLRHNNLNNLEDILKKTHGKHHKVWYMVDGLYSMYGDFAPLKDIQVLLDKYANFNLYIDDAHGMSWTGKNGSGYVLSQMELTDQVVLSTSLAKGFGAGGGLLVLNNKELSRKILTCGTSYTTGGPLQPPVLGACVASAKIHLTPDIYVYQNRVAELIERFIQKCDESCLPLMSHAASPIMYIGLGLPRVAYNMVKRLMKEGYFTNVGIFPGVPVRCAGVRITINRNQTIQDIDDLVACMTKHFPLVLAEENQTVADLERNFKTPLTTVAQRYPVQKKDETTSKFFIKQVRTIKEIDKNVWDDLLGNRGTFDWEGCRFLEETFCDNPEPENNWKFHYLIISDSLTGKPILATFFTELLCKDDMIAPAHVSQQIEEVRKKDKYYLTSKVVMLGSLLTEGNHLFIDRNNGQWQTALLELIRIMNDVKQECDATMLQLRDFDSNDIEMRDFLIKEGFIKVKMPDTHVLKNTKWQDENEYMKQLSKGNRWHFRRKILDNKPLFRVNVIDSENVLNENQTKNWHELYSNVKQKGLNINTYNLPLKLFNNMQLHPNWETVELRLKSGDKFHNEESLVAVGFCYKSSKNNYSMMAVGINYDYVYTHGCYRQALYQSVVRFGNLKCDNLYFGMDASIEKQRFGVEIIPKSVYIQANDNFNMELIGTIYNKN
ncbi:aminotransferase class I/II-fold pyridoxal phosphate-dependent enzyme [Flavobacterium psychrotolerans]|uniref:Aminotransferase class I/II n=1 Tax=Flavobacterium psychrotolerans TaxID=2169410 RepID=A0A2U1JHN8_9FLAO|nr:aminotransferase class I/II-fold pyridoxal phosphate-dependent enzyme [Flavobacterium psychrotolerans]PWA04383.1 aminotransferase class I/II [Flavobacterium psychrotolerans]